MSLYNYYSSYEEEQVSSSHPPLQCSDVAPDFSCTWSSFIVDTPTCGMPELPEFPEIPKLNMLSFADTPELMLSDTDDGSSCGGDDQSLSSSLRGGMRSKSSIWTGNYVQFGPVHVREYLRRLGDHPQCFDNYPLCIGWEHGEESVYDIDAYEEHKIQKRRRKRRGRRDSIARRLDTSARKGLLQKDLEIDLPDVGFECRLEMEPELVKDRWGDTDRVDIPLEESHALQNRDMNTPNHPFGFPDSMIKVEVLED